MGFHNFNIVPASGVVGTAGGLCLCWHDSISVNIIASNKCFISAIIKDGSISPPWLFCGVYAPSKKVKQPLVWDALTASISSVTNSVLLIGDFNNTTHQEEKIGGAPFCQYSASPFINFIDSNGLIDLGYRGNPFTWINKQGDGNDIQERLDRALVSPEWHIDYPKASVNNLPIIESDHAPLLLITKGEKLNNHKPFKFESCWLRDSSSKEVVRNAWNLRVFGNNQNKFCKKLRNTQVALRQWNKYCFGHCQSQITSLTNQIKTIQTLPRTHVNQRLEKNMLIHLDEIRTREQWIWKQKARIDWRDSGDKATKFFFLSTLIRRNKNAINKLCLDDGTWVSKRKAIGQAFVETYELLFKSSNPDLEGAGLGTGQNCVGLNDLISPSITDAQNASLVTPPTEAEIKDVLFSIGKLKAPGPDGFSAIFFQFYWETVGNDLIHIVKEYFSSGVMHNDLNHNYVALVPKRKTPTKVEHYRPISLCNISYKVISKLLAGRLKITLGDIISPLQSAFIPGRSISDNIILTQEILHKFKRIKGSKTLMAIKYDMAKAYDRVEWSFLERVMKLFGYDSHFINLIMNCISTTHMSFLINGKPFGNIKPSRGIRQGDPISSYLFLLCGEVLSRMFYKMEANNRLEGVRIGYNCPPITHLMFADDLICFCVANVEIMKR